MKQTRYTIGNNHFDTYNKTYSIDKEIVDITEKGDKYTQGNVEITKVGRIKIKKEDLNGLIIFAIENNILEEVEKEKRQSYNSLAMAPSYKPKKKTIKAGFINIGKAFKSTLSKPALERLDQTGSTNPWLMNHDPLSELDVDLPF